jgi:D-alanine-D-alanine ligase
LPGEIIPHHEFYTYAAKYLDPEGASLKTPAEIPEHLIKKIKQLAIKSFRALCCEGMARVDFFLTPDEHLYVNEANTLPGFTSISMYPKLWAISGLSYNVLVDRLVTLALQRFEKNRVLLNKSFNEALA